MKCLIFLIAAATTVLTDELPPSCKKPIYCNSDLLHYVQMARLFPDSKTFVDLHLKNDEDTTLQAFQELLQKTDNNPSREEVQSFVDDYFNTEVELDDWTPPDYTPDPTFLNRIQDDTLRQFAKDIHEVWPTLGRKIKSDVFENSNLYSIIPVDQGFIIPGGRFKELYYWDAYWIVEGLLISGMPDTVKGMLENFFQLLEQVGHIPNGGRWYYQERSQPPLLTAMMSLYYEATKDIDFLKAHIDDLEEELQYWLNTQSVAFNKDGRSFKLLRYYAKSSGPRPESYYEDYTNAQQFNTDERKEEFYIDLKSAAESGWDFSTRWFADENGENKGNLSTVHTKDIIPVDLNSIFANAMQTLGKFQAKFMNFERAGYWTVMSLKWKNAIEQVLWDEEDGVWYDYDLAHKQHRKYFYPSNVAPLWMGAVDRRLVKKHAPRVIEYLINSNGLNYTGGVPSSLERSGEQWDFPNAWPPLVSIVVNALEALNTPESKELAFKVAQVWVRACHKGFSENNQMFEKYDAEFPGKVGGGGEYTVQTGFGWSNGVVLEFISKYAGQITASDTDGVDK